MHPLVVGVGSASTATQPCLVVGGGDVMPLGHSDLGDQLPMVHTNPYMYHTPLHWRLSTSPPPFFFQVKPPPLPPPTAPTAVGHVVPVPRDRCGLVRGRVADIKVSWRVGEGTSGGEAGPYLNGRLGGLVV